MATTPHPFFTNFYAGLVKPSVRSFFVCVVLAHLVTIACTQIVPIVDGVFRHVVRCIESTYINHIETFAQTCDSLLNVGRTLEDRTTIVSLLSLRHHKFLLIHGSTFMSCTPEVSCTHFVVLWFGCPVVAIIHIVWMHVMVV